MTLLALRGGALGDFVLTVPTLRALRRRAGRLLLVARGRYAALWPDLADHVIDIDRAAWLFGGGRPPEAISEAVCWSLSGGEALSALGIASVRAGPPLPPPHVHASDHLRAVAGLRGPSPPPEVRPDPRVRAAISAMLPGPRPVVLAPGAGAPPKRWPHLAALASRLASVGIPTVWLPGRDEGLAGIQVDGAVLPALPLDGIVALASLCGVWVGNDTGTTHLAAATGARVIALFGPTDPRCWAPRPAPGGTVEVVGADEAVDAVATRVADLLAGAAKGRGGG